MMRGARKLVERGSCRSTLSATTVAREWSESLGANHGVPSGLSSIPDGSCALDRLPQHTGPHQYHGQGELHIDAEASCTSNGTRNALANTRVARGIWVPSPVVRSATIGCHTWSNWLSTGPSSRGFAASAFGGRQGGSSSGGGGAEAAAEVMQASEAARRVMEDPMSRLMASQGMPVGLSLGPKSRGGPGGSGSAAGSAADADGEEEDLSRPPRAEPAYQMEAFSDMLRATAASARRGAGHEAGAAASSGGGGGEDGDGFTAGVQRVGPSLDDSWGTTRETPADIARRIVESNLDVERDAAGAADEVDDDGQDEPLALSPSEQKYASLEAMSRDIKRLDEVFEVLASVPWLDEDVLAEKELKGVAQVGLLGTLEEVGFNIRPQLLRIWSGERGAELAAGPGLEFRDQAALMAILYHTQQIEDAHGPPPRGYLPKPPEQS